MLELNQVLGSHRLQGSHELLGLLACAVRPHLYHAEDQTYGFMHTRQPLYQLSYVPSLGGGVCVPLSHLSPQNAFERD